MSAIKKSVSMPDKLWEKLEERAKGLGYSTISAYLQYLVREDTMRQSAHVRGLEMRDVTSSSTEHPPTGQTISKYPPFQKADGPDAVSSSRDNTSSTAEEQSHDHSKPIKGWVAPKAQGKAAAKPKQSGQSGASDHRSKHSPAK